MKATRFFLLLFYVFTFSSCLGKTQTVVTDQSKYYEEECLRLSKENDSLQVLVKHVTDSMSVLHKEAELDFEANLILSDSINTLNEEITKLKSKPLMTKDNFISLYNYNQLKRYYKICKNNPSQWKYYKGWSTRVFEQ